MYVWDEQQTTGKVLPEIGRVAGNPSVYLDRLERFVRANGITLTYSEDIAPASCVRDNRLYLEVKLPVPLAIPLEVFYSVFEFDAVVF